MNKRNILAGERLKQCRKNAEKTLEQIGMLCGVHKTTVMRWEKGEIEKIGLPTIQLLASFFNVSPAWLSGFDAPMHDKTDKIKNPTVTTDTVKLPVIGNIAAGYEEIAIEDWSGETVEVPNSYLKGRKINDFIVLKVHGDSMYPEYHDGDKVVILKQNNLDRSGSVCAVLYNDEMATLKRVDVIDDKIKLTPLNHNYAPKTISGEEKEHFRIIGIPKMLIREIED
ncbi:MAG: helix-turn-helix domain-containing protein [Clostridia bacterium]|nr:helix-turn-helix domain-containing protein [Clostridia bacterium]